MDIKTLKSKLTYDTVTGIFVWNLGERHAGKIAGSILKNGYVQISVKGKRYLGHRLAWAFVYGKFPKLGLDHENRVRSDNWIDNLREATQAENMQNASLRKNNKCGFTGVDFHKSAGMFQARIMVNGVREILGHFETPEEASHAYVEAKKELHKFQPIISD